MEESGNNVVFPVTVLVTGSGPGISHRVHTEVELDVLSSLCGPVTVLVGAESLPFTTKRVSAPGLYISVDGSAWTRVCCANVVPLPSGYTQLRVGVVREAGQPLSHDVLVSADRTEHDPLVAYTPLPLDAFGVVPLEHRMYHMFLFDPTGSGQWRRCVTAVGSWKEFAGRWEDEGAWVPRIPISIVQTMGLSHAKIGVAGFRGVNVTGGIVTLGAPRTTGSMGFVEFDCAGVDELSAQGRARLVTLFTRMWETYGFRAVHIRGVRVRDLDLLATCPVTAVVITFHEEDAAADGDVDIWPAAVLVHGDVPVRPMPTDARVPFFPLPCVSELSLRNAPSRVLPLLAPVAQMFRVLEFNQVHPVSTLPFDALMVGTVWSNLKMFNAAFTPLSFPSTGFRTHFPVLADVEVTLGACEQALETLTALSFLGGVNLSIHTSNYDWARNYLKEPIFRILANGNFVCADTMRLAELPVSNDHESGQIIVGEHTERERFVADMVAVIQSAASKVASAPEKTPDVVRDVAATTTQMITAFVSSVEKHVRDKRDEEPGKYWPLFWRIDANSGVAWLPEEVPIDRRVNPSEEVVIVWQHPVNLADDPVVTESERDRLLREIDEVLAT
jgi:hypothetical protein